MPKVIFDGHIAQTRAIEPTADDLLEFKRAIAELALEAILHYQWEGPFYPKQQRAFVDLCEKFGVDHTYKKDRIAFATALIDFI